VITSAFFVQPLVNRLGERRLLLVGIAIATLSYVLWGIDNGWVFLLAIPVSCLAIYNAPSQALMTRRVSASEQGALQGALGAVRGLTMIAGPLIFLGVFYLFVGPWKAAHLPGAPWFLAAIMMLGALLVAVRVTGREDDVVLPTPSDLAAVSPLE
jgi:DHA1 family tetracycline resistance protein-like MFS transporter